MDTIRDVASNRDVHDHFSQMGLPFNRVQLVLLASIVFLIWCECGYCQYWYLGLIGILYALWGYARNKPQEPTAQELEEEAGVKVPGYE